MDENKNTSFFEKLAVENPMSQPPAVIPPNIQKQGPKKKIIFGITAVVILLFAVGTGVFLVQQNQNLRSEAALPPGCMVSYSGSGTNGPTSFTLSGDCPGRIIKFEGSSCPTTQTQVSSSGSSAGTYTANAPSGKCQQVDYDPSTDPGQGIGVCTCSGGGGDDGGDDEPTRTCGEPCSNDSMCKRGNPTAVCRNNVCVNPNCPGKTEPGANCACNTQNACGQACSITLGLCQPGSTCGFINVPTNQCANYETKGGAQQSAYQYCIPNNPQNGYKLAPRCEDIFTLRLAKPDGSVTGLTQADILAACAPASTTSPSPTPTGTASGQCGSLITVADSTFSPFTQTQNRFTTVTYNAPTAANRQVIGVKAKFHDDTEEYEYMPTITTSNGQTLTSLDHTCKDRANGWVDVCTPNENRIHSLTLKNYQQTPTVSLTSIKFEFREFESSDQLTFESLEWVYRDFCPSPSPSATPLLSAQCLTVAVYDEEWNRLSSTDFSQLVAGDKIRIAAQGSASQGTIDKARFTVNGVMQNETTTKRNGTNEFYIEYTLPATTKNFSVGGQLHHATLGWF